MGMANQTLGEFEQLVLWSVVRLGNQGYGTTIQREIESRAKRTCALGALYTTLDRMEQKGLISSRVGEPTAERGGRAKRYFQIEGAGAHALKESYEATQRMAKGLIPKLEGAL
jgi:PadR family transcriptional regulator, regulatory protein PadR